MYYDTCPNCGSNLDPGEKCDCQEARVLSGAGNKKGPQVREHHTGHRIKYVPYSITEKARKVKGENNYVKRFNLEICR